jgi:hypothetical protein
MSRPKRHSLESLLKAPASRQLGKHTTLAVHLYSRSMSNSSAAAVVAPAIEKVLERTMGAGLIGILLVSV